MDWEVGVILPSNGQSKEAWAPAVAVTTTEGEISFHLSGGALGLLKLKVQK